jgi:hypothetical protein
MDSNSQTRTAFGPFHRLVAPEVQDTETVINQLMSGEIWGVAFVRITQDLLP